MNFTPTVMGAWYSKIVRDKRFVRWIELDTNGVSAELGATIRIVPLPANRKRMKDNGRNGVSKRTRAAGPPLLRQTAQGPLPGRATTVIVTDRKPDLQSNHWRLGTVHAVFECRRGS